MNYKISPPVVWVIAVLMSVSPLAVRAGTLRSCGMEDIDVIRREVIADPTAAENAKSRRSALLRWWRLLWHRGQDMRAFDDIAEALLNTDNGSKANWVQIDRGYTVLNEMWENPQMIGEVRGEKQEYDGTTTNWPYYMGPTQHNSGYTPDPGPSEGKLAWRFPKGYKWNAVPVVDQGKIYLSSPGIDVVAFCLDEETGAVDWRARQFGEQFYGTATSKYDPIVSAEHVLIRNGMFAGGMKVFEKGSGQLSNVDGRNHSSAAHTFAYTRIDSRVVLADAISGQDVWTYDTKTRLSGEPQTDDSWVYAAGRNGEVFRFDKATGKVSWTVQITGEVQGKLSVGSEYIYAGMRAGVLIALNKGDGSVAWKYDSGEEEVRSRQFFSSVWEGNGRLYFGTASSQIICLDAGDGEVVWNFRVSDWVRSRPIEVNGVVYAATLDSRLYALRDGPDGVTELWSNYLGQHGFTADLVAGESAILAADRKFMLHSVDYNEGTTRWRHGILDGAWVDGEFIKADYTAALPGSPTVVDGVVYIGGPDGFVNAVDVESGQELWKFEIDGVVSGAVSIVEGKAMFGEIGRPTGAFDGTVDLTAIGAPSEEEQLESGPKYFALDAKTGAVIWSVPGYGYTWVSAVHHDGVMFIGNMNGNVYGVDIETGQKLWSYYTATGTPQEDKAHDHHQHGWPPGVYCMPVADEESFYVGSWSGYYFAFDQKTGKLRWRTQTGWPETGGGLPDSAAPTLHKDHLYVQKRGFIIAAINIHSGEIDWEWKAPPGHLQNGTLAALGNSVYASTARRVTHIPFVSWIYRFADVENGSEEIWKHREGGGLTAPVVTDEQLIFGSSTGVYLTSLDPETGKLKWRVFTGGEMTENVPAIYGNRAFNVSKNGWLNAVK